MAAINIKGPTSEDTARAEGDTAIAWLRLQRAMLDCSDRGPVRRSAAVQLLDAIDVEGHVGRRFYGVTCPGDCWVCRRAE